MDKARIKQYNSDIASWLSKQSFLYQIFNSFRIVGAGVSGFAYFFGVLVKLTFLCLILGIIAFFYVARKHNDKSYSDNLASKAMQSLKAEEVKMSKLKGGTFASSEIADFRAIGSANSFFDRLRAFGLRMDVGNLVFKKGAYKTPSVFCNKMEVDLKVSATAANADMYQPLFRMDDWFRFGTMTVQSFNCNWGYSTNSKGSIRDSNMELRRSDRGCEILLKGGTLNYSWLKEVRIVKMQMVAGPSGFAITAAEFKRGDAIFTLKMGVEEFGENPYVRGVGEIVNGNIHELIREEFVPYIDGVVDSSYEFSGSPNSLNGLDFRFSPLNPTDETPEVPGKRADPYFRFTYKLPIIHALGAVDRTINYRSLKFVDNQWELEIRNGEIYARDVRLIDALEEVEISTQFALKEPQEAYIAGILDTIKPSDYIRLMERPWLREEGLRIIEQKKSLGDAQGVSSLTREDYFKLLKSERHFYGECTIKVHEESFLGKEVIQDTYPPNEDGVRVIKVPLDGHIKTLTRPATNDLYFLSHKIK